MFRKYSDQKDSTFLSPDSEIAEATHKYVADFVHGLGHAAWENKDWETAIVAYDVITEGGILNNPDVKDKITNIPLSKNDYETHIQIAEAIQNRLEEKEQRQQQEERNKQLRENAEQKKTKQERARQNRQSRLAAEEIPATSSEPTL